MTEPIEIFTSDSDAWDDSALIKAWDSTIHSFKSESMKSNGIRSNEDSFAKPSSNHISSKKKATKKRNKKKKPLTLDSWKVGERCQAKFSEDGFYYDAEIVALCETFATVCFVDYDEENDVMFSDLKKVSAKTQENPMTDFVIPPNAVPNWPGQFSYQPPNFSMLPPQQPPPPCPIHHHIPYSMNSQTNVGHVHGPIPQPPCPPHPFNSSKCSDESLAAMLMSWYKTGFTTGYYQALREHNIIPKDNSEKGPL